ncbi:MAG: type IV-A pilus assembly ATPase PilB, partial [Pseudomonas sp.]
MTDVVLTGLAKQLVVAELLTEQTAQKAYEQARRDKISLVHHLVESKLLKSITLAEVASDQFGIPFLD